MQGSHKEGISAALVHLPAFCPAIQVAHYQHQKYPLFTITVKKKLAICECLAAVLPQMLHHI